ncbi:uncharacterized protein LOC123404027 isoform X1 [Hordeum vulgare subsp. vulgare]|uniref:uncharacterized protein LOC123404027 isoform X1 n=1 Tax=Hordeum vulgare subsp. vulgare TaxID=112509 RepID=UPI0002965E2C|nr:uncharacterized protein LOC123404027 isoform X1 [Hordeum vulgare subsp. vulgare]XP_044953868.1 uncharacterized protein LOC123404027 isoform X1 [Hordeum vulgare subsp. vulgare]XP_044953869.1 uncharacterized protein LOC123404027 isoform X1 [Hordeum vulgare subsp. vulgare]
MALSAAFKKRERHEAGLEGAFDMQKSELMVREMEAERFADNAVKKELRQMHLEVEKLRAENQELTIKLQKLTEEVKADKRSEGKQSFPELHAELEGLQKEYQYIRSEVEHNRDINTKQAEQMKTMEMSLIAMTEQVDKLHAEMQNTDMRAQGLATAVQVAAGQSGTAQAQVAYGSPFDNVPAQTTQVDQSEAAQAPAASAAIYPYAYSPAVAHQQTTQAWPYAYGMPYAYTNPMAGHQDVQASGHAGYPIAGYDQNATPYYTVYPGHPAGYNQNGVPYYTGYPVGYDQDAMHFYLVAYAATAVGVPVTDAANMDDNAGSPAGARQAESRGDATVHITLASDASPDAAISFRPLEM